jgi:hypothetical protein
MKDLVALILGGSSKPAFTPESRYGGRFGEGFLVSHILSKKVQVEGKAERGGGNIQDFEFTLDRSGVEGEILKNINSAYQSLNRPTCVKPSARFTYSLSDGLAKEAAEQGLRSLERLIPFVLALVPHLKSVEVARNSSIRVWERGEERRQDQDIVEIVPIETLELLSEEAEQIQEAHVAIIKLSDSANDVQCLVEARPKGNSLYDIVLPSREVPRLFYPYPLLGKTEKIGLPVVLGGRFEPSKDREDILLSGDSPEVKANKDLVKRGLFLIPRLAEYAVSRGWGNAHLVSRLVPFSKDSEVSGAEWWNKEFQNVIHIVKEKSIVVRNDGQRYSPKEIVFPAPILEYFGPDKDDGGEELSLEKAWELWAKLYYVPDKQVANDWQLIVREWNKVLGKSEFKIYDVSQLAGEIREVNSVDKFAKKRGLLGKADTVISWLRDFLVC